MLTRKHYIEFADFLIVWDKTKLRSKIMNRPKNISPKVWDIMVFYTKFYSIFFAVIIGFTLVMALCVIVGNYAY